MGVSTIPANICAVSWQGQGRAHADTHIALMVMVEDDGQMFCFPGSSSRDTMVKLTHDDTS